MCKHKRIYTWLAFDPIEGDLLCCGCLDCHETFTKVLKSIPSKSRPTNLPRHKETSLHKRTWAKG